MFGWPIKNWSSGPDTPLRHNSGDMSAPPGPWLLNLIEIHGGFMTGGDRAINIPNGPTRSSVFGELVSADLNFRIRVRLIILFRL